MVLKEEEYVLIWMEYTTSHKDMRKPRNGGGTEHEKSNIYEKYYEKNVRTWEK